MRWLICAAAVPSARLPASEVEMPLSGLGLCCRASAQGQAVAQSVYQYLMLGGRLLDDAIVYNNHYEVGLGIQQAMQQGVPRSEIFVTSKIPADEFGYQQSQHAVMRMLQELQLEYIDLVLLHWAASEHNPLPCAFEQDQRRSYKRCRQETWLGLEVLKGRGLVKSIGVSNFGPRQIEELNALGNTPVQVNQLEYHPWSPQVHRDTVRWCLDKGIVVTAYGSMGSAGNAEWMTALPELQPIANAFGKTVGQILLRWAVQQGVVVIPGTGNPDHMRENLDIFDFELPEHIMQAISTMVPQDQSKNYFEHVPDLLL